MKEDKHLDSNIKQSIFYSFSLKPIFRGLLWHWAYGREGIEGIQGEEGEEGAGGGQRGRMEHGISLQKIDWERVFIGGE